MIEPIESEKEKYTEDDYENMLYEVYGKSVNVCGMEMDSVYVFREMDETAYRCGFNDYQEYETVYLCPICKDEYDDYDDAQYCCQEDDEEELDEEE